MKTSRVPFCSVCIAVVAFLLLHGGCGRLIDEDLQVVAKIDKESITVGDVLKELRHIPFADRVEANKDREGRLGVLNDIIDKRVLIREAGLRNITVTDEEIEQALRASQPSYFIEGGQGLQDVEVTHHGGTRDEKIRERLLQEKLLRTEITEQKMRQYYAMHKNEFQTEERVRVKLLVIKDLQTAREIFHKITAGQEFSAMAQQYADNPSFVGGVDVAHYFRREQLWPDVREALTSMSVGQMALFQSPADHYYRILQFVDKTTILPFEEATQQIFEELKDQFVAGVRQNVQIVIFDKKLEHVGI